MTQKALLQHHADIHHDQCLLISGSGGSSSARRWEMEACSIAESKAE
jgi:hypothetical protein